MLSFYHRHPIHDLRNSFFNLFGNPMKLYFPCEKAHDDEAK